MNSDTAQHILNNCSSKQVHILVAFTSYFGNKSLPALSSVK